MSLGVRVCGQGALRVPGEAKGTGECLRARPPARAVDGGVSDGNGSAGWRGGSPSPAPEVSLPVLCREVFQRVVHTSAKHRAGFEQLDQAILELAGAPALAQGPASWAVNERQAEALVRAHEALGKVRRASVSSPTGTTASWLLAAQPALLAPWCAPGARERGGRPAARFLDH